MTGIISILGLVGQLLPMFVQLLQHIFAAEGAGGPGPEKKAAVLSGLEGAYGAAQVLAGDGTFVKKVGWDTLQPLVSGAVDGMVTLLNVAGVFAKGTHPSAPEKWTS